MGTNDQKETGLLSRVMRLFGKGAPEPDPVVVEQPLPIEAKPDAAISLYSITPKTGKATRDISQSSVDEIFFDDGYAPEELVFLDKKEAVDKRVYGYTTTIMVKDKSKDYVRRVAILSPKNIPLDPDPDDLDETVLAVLAKCENATETLRRMPLMSGDPTYEEVKLKYDKPGSDEFALELRAQKEKTQRLKRKLTESDEKRRELSDSGAYMRQRLEESSSEMQTLKKRAEEAEKRNLIDEMTGLYNHKYFKQQRMAWLEEAIREGSSFYIVDLDMIGLSTFNSLYGEPKGNEALVNTARALQETIREYEVAVRLHSDKGDEFRLLLKARQDSEVDTVIARIRTNLAETKKIVNPRYQADALDEHGELRFTESDTHITPALHAAYFKVDAKVMHHYITQMRGQLDEERKQRWLNRCETQTDERLRLAKRTAKIESDPSYATHRRTKAHIVYNDQILEAVKRG